MNKRIVFILIALYSLFACSGDNKTQWPKITVESKPWTRWWWLGSAVDSTNLAYNIENLGKAGIGGVEITPIYGVKGNDANNIKYISDKWMKMLRITEAEADKYNMLVDMNTGTGWPFGGPEVSIEDAATKAFFQEYEIIGGKSTKLEIKIEDERQKDFSYLASLMAYSEDSTKADLTKKVSSSGTLEWDAPVGNWRLIALFVGKTRQQVKRAAPGGEGYVMNHFDAKAVKNYLNKFEDAFARTNTAYPHTFFNDSYEIYGADWTPTFLDDFYKRRGYKLQDYFLELLGRDSTDISGRVVSDYRETLSDLLMENFTRQWTEWAHSHGATTRNQAHGSPANLIDLYATVDIPECEIFGITDFNIPGLRKDSLIKINDGDPVTLKMASSAAHIAGKKYTSAETFTWLTEHFRTSLSQCKPEIDQMFTSGVNHVYFHGTPYSPQKAEWPGWQFYASVNMSPTNSIWRDASAFFTYITRTQSFLQYGQPDNDLLIYFPVYDIWYEQRNNYYFAFSIHGLREKLPKFYSTVENIRQGGRDVDYITDSFIKSATVENGLIKTKGGAMYKALVMPAAKRIPLETAEKIYQLASEGAKIIFIEQYPIDVPGLNQFTRRKKQLEDLIRRFPAVDFSKTEKNIIGKGEVITGYDYSSLFEEAQIKSESFSNDFGMQFIRRKNETGYHYFLSLLTSNEVNGWVPLAITAKSAMFFNPMNGDSGKAATRSRNGITEIYIQLKPGESIILKIFSDIDIKEKVWNYFFPTDKELKLTGNWKINFIDSKPEINETFNMSELKSWTELPDENTKKNMGTARYSSTFLIDNSLGEEYLLDLGDVRESARVYVNGKEVTTLFAVPFTTYIGKYLKKGENLLEIDVANLPANRISDYDRRGVEWRIFNEINFVDINYKSTLYDKWEVMPSGLLGPVSIKEVYSKRVDHFFSK